MTNKPTYVAPQLRAEVATTQNMLAASTMSITISDTDFDGEGRVKSYNEWEQIWGEDEE